MECKLIRGHSTGVHRSLDGALSIVSIFRAVDGTLVLTNDTKCRVDDCTNLNVRSAMFIDHFKFDQFTIAKMTASVVDGEPDIC